MTDKTEVTGIEIKINGEKVLLSIEEWKIKQELDDGLLHVEGIPYPYPRLVASFTPSVLYAPGGTYEPSYIAPFTTSASVAHIGDVSGRSIRDVSHVCL